MTIYSKAWFAPIPALGHHPERPLHHRRPGQSAPRHTAGLLIATNACFRCCYGVCHWACWYPLLSVFAHRLLTSTIVGLRAGLCGRLFFFLFFGLHLDFFLFLFCRLHLHLFLVVFSLALHPRLGT